MKGQIEKVVKEVIDEESYKELMRDLLKEYLKSDEFYEYLTATLREVFDDKDVFGELCVNISKELKENIFKNISISFKG